LSDDIEDDAALNELEDGQVEDDKEPDAKDDADKIDLAVEANDAAMVDEVAAEVNTETLLSLTHAEINFGRFSLSKVWLSVILVVALY